MADSKDRVVANRIASRVERSAALLERMGVTAEQFQRVALDALVTNDKIAECDPASLDRAIIQCIQLGLLPDGRQAVIVPFRGTATLIPMIEGRIAMAKNATRGLALRVRVVYDGDGWEYSEGLHPKLEHVPNPELSRTDADVIAAYAVANFPRGAAPEYEVMLRADLDRYRSYSLSGDRGPWGSHYVEMCKKTVLGQLLKRLPRLPGTPDTPPELDTLEVTGMAGVDWGDGPPERPALPAPPDAPVGLTDPAPDPGDPPAENAAPAAAAAPPRRRAASGARARTGSARPRRQPAAASPPDDEPPPHTDVESPF